MNRLKPSFTSAHGHSKIFVHPKLKDCTHAFLRLGKVLPPLFQPYSGPHKILPRSNKHITIIINGKKSCISLDRIKPAFVFHDLPNNTDNLETKTFSDSHPIKSEAPTTKSGRQVRFPKRLITEVNYSSYNSFFS